MTAEPTVSWTWVVADRPIDAAVEALGEALRRIGWGARLAVPGGSAARALGPLRRRLGSELWSGLRVTWVDERRVAHSSADSNRGTAHRAGWLGPEAPVGLELALWLDGESPAGAVERVTRGLERQFAGGLDALLLGLGEDGHVASLFPGHAELAAHGPVALVDDAPKPPPERITLTLPLLGSASTAVLLATGASKQRALQRLRATDQALPATRLSHLTVVTDQALD